ncbi:MAG: SBBP repeat-containing protein [Candidatus Kapaibacterium sp.]
MSSQAKSNTIFEMHRVDFDFYNANTPHIISSNQKSSEYIVTNGITEELLKTKEVLYKNIFDGIDFRAYFNKYGDFEFDFIVNVGANPDDIKIVQKYNKSSKVAGNNELEIGIEFGSMMLDAPYSYQGKLSDANTIHSSYSLQGDIVSFEIGNYNKKEILVIDPIARIMGSYFGSQANETAQNIEEDSGGNYYITGYTESPTNIAVGGYQLVHGGFKDAYLAKFNSNNSRVWSTYFGDLGFDIANDLTIDNQGNIVIVGETSSLSKIATPNAHQLTYGGGIADGFVAKFISNGNLLWATYYGGQEEDKINGVSTDNNGNIYVVGQTLSDNNINFNGYQSQRDGMRDAFVVKFNPLGARMWATYYGGGADEYGNDITHDNSNNVFIVGQTESDNNISVQGNVPTRQGQIDAFVSSFDADGAMRWGTYYGGSSNEMGTTITSDGYYIYFGGKTQSFNGIYLNGHQNNLSGGWDGFLVRYDFFQNPYWGTYYGGPGDDNINSIAVKGNSIYTVGSTNSTSKINLLGWQQNYGGGTFDGTLAKYQSSGPMEWSTYYGGSGQDELTGI